VIIWLAAADFNQDGTADLLAAVDCNRLPGSTGDG